MGGDEDLDDRDWLRSFADLAIARADLVRIEAQRVAAATGRVPELGPERRTLVLPVNFDEDDVDAVRRVVVSYMFQKGDAAPGAVPGAAAAEENARLGAAYLLSSTRGCGLRDLVDIAGRSPKFKPTTAADDALWGAACALASVVAVIHARRAERVGSAGYGG